MEIYRRLMEFQCKFLSNQPVKELLPGFPNIEVYDEH